MAPTVPTCGGRVGLRGCLDRSFPYKSRSSIQLQVGVMLESIIWILLMGFLVGQIARRLKAPALVGMVLVGILFGLQFGNAIGSIPLGAADSLGTIVFIPFHQIPDTNRASRIKSQPVTEATKVLKQEDYTADSTLMKYTRLS